MQSEIEWVGRIDEEENTGAAERYKYFMRPEPFEDLGAIETIQDEFLEQPMKVREMSVGMIRNAKDENKKRVLVYLHPFPHLRIDTAKPLQGWYKSLHEPKGVRARPCFSEAILTEPYGGYCAVGCAFCVPGNTLVQTPDGETYIQTVKVGDLVLGRTLRGLEFVPVLETTRRVTKQTLRFTLSNGRTLVCTPDHLLWSQTEQVWKKADEFKIRETLQALSEDSTRPKEDLLLKGVLAGSKPTSTFSSQAMSLRRSDKEVSSSLRQMSFGDSFSKWENGERKTEYSKSQAQVRRDKEEDEQARYEYSEGNGVKSQWTEVSRLETTSSRKGTTRQIGIQTIEATEVCLSEREIVYNAFSLGKLNRSLFRQTISRLGLRTKSNSNTFGGILTGFHFEQWDNYRGQGLSIRNGLREIISGEKIGIQNSSLQPEEVGAVRDTYIQNIEELSEETEVYDIQTACENFYAEKVLIHNCYINSGVRGYRGTGLITVPINYGEQITKQLGKMYKAAAGYFSSFTDPFTPLEAYYHNTQRAAEEFVKVGLPIFFLSRLRYPDWAIKLLTINKHSYAQKSLNTCDGEDWRYLSPGALPLKQHLADITKLRKKGIYVSIQCNPVVAGVTSHEQIEKLFSMLANAGANHVIVKFVEAGYSWAPAMVERMIKRFGKRGEEFAKLFTENIGGQKTICEEYRLPAHERYSAYAKKVGLTYATCYEYRKERDNKGNVVNSTGISIGREFTTAEQCHGQRVPVYQRDNLEENFKPIDECPPSGCLYCASENNGEARCGDKELGEAKALRYADYKKQLIQIS